MATPSCVGLEHDLGVGATAESDTLALESTAQIRRVVDLAVVHKGDAAILGLHRLMAGTGQVEDAQARMAEPCGPNHLHVAIVRPPVVEGFGHRPDEA